MSEWNGLVQWLYGDVRTGRGFWYSHSLHSVSELTDGQLLWVPDETSLCMLWHVGHIAHREKLHVAQLIQGQEDTGIPERYDVFGAEWCPVSAVREAVDSVAAVCEWVETVRNDSSEYIATLSDDDFHRPAVFGDGLSIGHWLLVTVSHGALHIGKIQQLRSMLEGRRDSPC